MAKYTDAQLNLYRRMGDAQADAVMEAIIEVQGMAAAGRFFDRLIREVELPLAELPAPAAGLLAQTRQLPDWIDAREVATTQALFLDHGPKMLVLLYYKSLPLLYACAAGAQVLVRTGRLHRPDEGWQTYTRRIAETAQFMLMVMQPGGLQAGGAGIAAIQKVRLIHASIRYFLRAEGWDDAKLGTPINQEDMAITLMTFSINLIDGLRQFGIPIPAAEALAFQRTWNAIGHNLGVAPELLPADLEEARCLLERVLERQAAASEGGKILADALLRFAGEQLPLEQMKAMPRDLMRFCIGDTYAAMLGIPVSAGCLSGMLPRFLMHLFQSGERLEDLASPRLRQLLDRLSGYTTEALFNYFDAFKQRPALVPRSLARAWGAGVQSPPPEE